MKLEIQRFRPTNLSSILGSRNGGCSGAAQRKASGGGRAIFYYSLSSSAVEVAVAEVHPILCGRGDKETKKGKIFKESFGNSRPTKGKMIERVKDEVEAPGSTPWPLPFKLI